MLDRNTLTGGIFLVALYIVVSYPVATILATGGLSILLYAVTKSEAIVLGFMLASLFIRDLNRLFIPRAQEPVGVEAFQVRDAPSVTARLEKAKVVTPKVESITGVLESPHILNNTPLQAMNVEDGVPGASIPASSKGRQLIRPLEEGFVGAPNMSMDMNPVANPFLQDEEDDEAVETSLITKGTDMTMDDSSEIDGLTNHAAM
jgi:hypothetical protein